ncbi:MAG: DUF1028 domain-containing protein [Bacteroidia bacterium]
MKDLFLLLSILLSPFLGLSQDTFSIVAVDSTTGEVGSAGASCLDASVIAGGVSIIGDLIPAKGAINTQAAYRQSNQTNARNQMLMGATPDQIINYLIANDVQNDATIRQYGIAALDSNRSPRAAAYTGANCFDYKNQIVGPYYSIQGNILLGQEILDSMETRFLNASGSLAERLMEALQGANVPGADSRCLNEGVSSQSAYIRVARPNDIYASPYLDIVVAQTPFGKEPIDSLQILFDNWSPPNCSFVIPADVLQVNQNWDTTLSSKSFWVCTGDSLTLSGNFNTVFLEDGAYYQGTTGGLNTVYIPKEAVYDAGSQTINTIFHGPNSKIIKAGAAAVVTSCDSVIYDYSAAPASICALNTALDLRDDFSWRYYFVEADQSLRLSRTLNLVAGELGLYGINGALVNSRQIKAGESTIEWPVGSISSGIYLLRWRSGTANQSAKIWVTP